MATPWSEVQFSSGEQNLGWSLCFVARRTAFVLIVSCCFRLVHKSWHPYKRWNNRQCSVPKTSGLWFKKKRPRGCLGKTPAQTVCKTNWLVYSEFPIGLWSSPIYWLVESLKFHHQPTIIYQSYQSYSLIWSPYFMVKKNIFFVTIIINQLGYFQHCSAKELHSGDQPFAQHLSTSKNLDAPRDELDTSERCHQIKCVNFICLHAVLGIYIKYIYIYIYIYTYVYVYIIYIYIYCFLPHSSCWFYSFCGGVNWCVSWKTWGPEVLCASLMIYVYVYVYIYMMFLNASQIVQADVPKGGSPETDWQAPE